MSSDNESENPSISPSRTSVDFEFQNFILPGGSELASRLHIARTVCRRAERAVCRLSEKENVNTIFIQYLNRLSDWLFTLARVSNRNSNIEDTIWNPD